MSEETFGPSPDGTDEANTDKPKRKRAPSQGSSRPRKGDVFTADDCTSKIFQLYTLTGRVLRTTKGARKEKDFTEEGQSLSRLSEKYMLVSVALKMLDPVFLTIGVANKFMDHFGEYADRKKQEKAAKKAEQSGIASVEIVGNSYEQPFNPTAYHPS